MLCPKCGRPITTKPVVRAKYVRAARYINTTRHTAANKDVPHYGLNVLSCLIPAVGLILWCTTFRKTPNRAKQFFVFSLIGLSFDIATLMVLII